MSLKPAPILPIPEGTVRAARRVFPKGSVATRLRDEFGSLYQDQDFQALFPSHRQPGLPLWRLAFVTVLQFLENLSDRQAAEAVRARIDWQYALGLELADPGFHFSVLTEFRARLIAGGAEQLLLDRMLEQFQQRGLVKASGKQRTDFTHVLAGICQNWFRWNDVRKSGEANQAAAEQRVVSLGLGRSTVNYPASCETVLFFGPRI